jgi:hypothetical protein
MEQRHLHIRAAVGGITRSEEYMGKTYTVVPVVALVEGVIHAMNAAQPELVQAAAFSYAPVAWNGRPVFLGHPMKNGAPVSGNTPETLETLSMGLVFGAQVKSKKLVMEAWIDPERAANLGDEGARLLERLAAGDVIEISVGAYVETDDSTGEYNGKPYEGEWINIIPDHLALLPEGDTGACSVEAGCGVRAAQTGEPMATTEKKKSTSWIGRLMQTFRGLQNPDEMSDNDVRRSIGDALRAVDPRAYYPEAVYTDYFVYCVYSGDGGMSYYRRGYTLDANGSAVLSGDPVEVEPVLTYEDVAPELTAAAASEPSPTNTPAGAGCSCHTAPITTAKEQTMDKATRIKALIEKSKGMFTEADSKFLETASDEQLAAFESRVPAEVPATPKAVEPVVAAAAAVAPKAVTFDELLANASPETRDSINEGIRIGRERKVASIATLKASGRCTISDEKLTAMSQGELDQLVKLADVKVATDFSGLGTARVETNEAPAVPDLAAGIRASRAGK